ncbi:MAG: CRISPR-associated endonuclease Cas2 [Fimbriimonadales bacterium]|nr:CRISPR-associated endonuclease Cas2 [Fimbriimonadales bacterium]
MWLLLTFDLPMETKVQRRSYRRLVHRLHRWGFRRMQLSVFARFVRGDEQAKLFELYLRTHCPPEGEIRLIRLTDAQYDAMVVIRGGARVQPEDQPDQFELFGDS